MEVLISSDSGEKQENYHLKLNNFVDFMLRSHKKDRLNRKLVENHTLLEKVGENSHVAMAAMKTDTGLVYLRIDNGEDTGMIVNSEDLCEYLEKYIDKSLGYRQYGNYFVCFTVFDTVIVLDQDERGRLLFQGDKAIEVLKSCLLDSYLVNHVQNLVDESGSFHTKLLSWSKFSLGDFDICVNNDNFSVKY